MSYSSFQPTGGAGLYGQSQAAPSSYAPQPQVSSYGSFGSSPYPTQYAPPSFPQSTQMQPQMQPQMQMQMQRQQQPMQQQQPGYGRQMNPVNPMNPMGAGNPMSNRSPYQNVQQQDEHDPLQNKLLILYVKAYDSRDEPSRNAMLYAASHPEILIQDVMSIKPLPPWLYGVPTLLDIRRGQPFYGQQAMEILKIYDTQKRMQGGAQTSIVVPTSHGQSVPMNYSTPFDDRSAGVPVGSSSTQISGASEVDVSLHRSQENEHLYTQASNVGEEDVAAYMARRNQVRKTPVQWRPSPLQNGEWVSM